MDYLSVIGWLFYHPLLFGLVVLVAFISVVWLFNLFCKLTGAETKGRRHKEDSEKE